MRKAINFFRSYYDVAKELSDKDRLAFYDAVLKKQFENIDSNLTGMANFAYVSQKHSIDSQIKGYYDKTKDEKFNPIAPPTGGAIVPPCQQVQVEVKEKGKEQYKFDFKNSLLEFSTNKQLIEDWLLVRKNKKATNTKTAFDSFMNEVNISDLTIDEILKICVEKSWSGYKFKWIQNLRATESKEVNSNIITLAVESHSKGINLIEQKYGNKPNDIGSLGN